MEKVFWLVKENLQLSRAEVEALAGKSGQLFDELLLLNTGKRLAHRLAYTRAVYHLLFQCKKRDLLKKIQHHPWQRIYQKDFYVQLHHTKEYTAKQLAALIWLKLKSPKVNVRTPTTKIDFFFQDKNVVCGKLIEHVKQPYEQRKAHKRPCLHPTSMHPRLARALVNLTGIQRGKLYDPFCGSGGILIEAGLMGLKPVGYDIEEKLVDKARRNLRHYGITPFVEQKDATKIKHKMNYVVTDLPYGRGTKKQRELYKNFLNLLKHKLGKRAVIVFPHYANHRTLIRNAKLKLRQEFTVYVHKTLSRKITVLEP